MKCTFCDKEIELEDAVYCPFCGKKQRPEQKRFGKKVAHRSRPNGSGSVTQLSKNNFKARLTVCVDNGSDKVSRKEITKSGFRTKTEALKAIPALRDQWHAHAADSGTQSASINSLWEQFRETDDYKNLSLNMQNRFSYAFQRWEPLYKRSILDLTVDDLQKVVDEKASTHYPAQDMKVLMSHLYTLGDGSQTEVRNLATKIHIPAAETKNQPSFNLGDLFKLWNAFESGDIFAGYILLMSYTSMMPKELFLLEKNMVDFEKQQIVGVGQKTETRKELPILFGKGLVPVLRALCDSSASPNMVLDMCEDTFRARFKDTLSKYSCSDLTPYACRHTTETLLKLNGVSEYIQFLVMRHKQKNITDSYAHAEQLIPPAIRALDGLTHQPDKSDFEKAGQALPEDFEADTVSAKSSKKEK